MSDHRQELSLPVSAESAMAAARRATAELGWRLAEESDGEIVARERLRSAHGRWPASARVSIREQGDGCSVDLWGRMAGVGPLISERLEAEMDAFARRLREAAGTAE